MTDLEKRIENAFTYHPPNGAQAQAYDHLRSEAKRFAHVIARAVPECDERDEALRRVRDAVMWANAGISCNS